MARRRSTKSKFKFYRAGTKITRGFKPVRIAAKRRATKSMIGVIRPAGTRIGYDFKPF